MQRCTRSRTQNKKIVYQDENESTKDTEQSSSQDENDQDIRFLPK